MHFAFWVVLFTLDQYYSVQFGKMLKESLLNSDLFSSATLFTFVNLLLLST